MTLYSRGDDPACHCVRIVVLEKGLDVRLVEADPARPPEDLILGVPEDRLRPAAPLGDAAGHVRRDEDVARVAHHGAEEGVLVAQATELRCGWILG